MRMPEAGGGGGRGRKGEVGFGRRDSQHHGNKLSVGVTNLKD